MSAEQPERDTWLEMHLDDAGDALAALSCPWFRGLSSCATGCQLEPSCQTDAPTDGWAAQLLRAAQALDADEKGEPRER